MDLVSVGRVLSFSAINCVHSPTPALLPPRALLFPTCSPRRPALHSPTTTTGLLARAKKRNADVQPLLQPTTVREAEEEEQEEDFVDDYEEMEGMEEEEFIEDFGDEIIMEDDEDFEEDFGADDGNVYVGDGAGGGGISLAGTGWDQKALSLAEEVSMSFDGDLKIYAFKTFANCTIALRIEKLSTKYGSPSMTDIEAFSSAYRARLDEAVLAGTIPEDISLEVSSPGVERVIRVPEDLERFKEKPMYVRYITDADATAAPQESDGVFRLVSFDLGLGSCTWGLADVRINREKAGKGRPLSKKQREWRLQTSFDSLRLVRVFSDC